MARTKFYPDDLRQRLTAAAYERLKLESAEHVSLRRLAASVGTSTNAIYSIFGGKDGLIGAVILAARDTFLERQAVHITDNPTIEHLAAAGRTYRTWAREHPALYRLVFGGGAERGAGAALIDAVLHPLRELLGRMMDAGIVRRVDPEELCLSLWAATHGYVLLEMDLWPEGLPGADTRYDRHLATFAQGFLTPEALQHFRVP